MSQHGQPPATAALSRFDSHVSPSRGVDAVAPAEVSRRIRLPAPLYHRCRVCRGSGKVKVTSRDLVENSAEQLLDRLRLETEPLAWWWAISDVCATALHATDSTIYVCETEDRLLREVHHARDGFAFGPALSAKGRHIASRALRSRRPIERISVDGPIEVAVPVYAQPDTGEVLDPRAVIVLRFQPGERLAIGLVQTHIGHALAQLWPICAYASIRQAEHAPKLTSDTAGETVTLDETLKSVLRTLRQTLGFDFATISLVDGDEIRAEVGDGELVTPRWLEAAHHPLDSNDIQADVLRSGRTAVISRYDRRLDPEIWRTYSHKDLVRIFVPLGHIGTIEAGFHKRKQRSIHRLLVKITERYASDITIRLQNALLADQNAMLRELHEMNQQFHAGGWTEPEFLSTLPERICRALQADIVILYPVDEHTKTFKEQFAGGHLWGDARRLGSPTGKDNVVSHIVLTSKAYYRSDVQTDPRLLGEAAAHPTPQRSHRTFTERQGICSFAGVPLQSRGRVLGVLCINYRQRRSFGARERQKIELVAQQVAHMIASRHAIVASAQLVVAQERQLIQDDLHDNVKNSALGLIGITEGSLDALQAGDLEAVRGQLEKSRKAAEMILDQTRRVLRQMSRPRPARRTQIDRSRLRQLLQSDLAVLPVDPDHVCYDLERSPAVLPPALAETLRQITREAVSNAGRHSRAEHICVRVRRGRGDVRLCVEDDGCGFEPGLILGDEHRGLGSMRRRAASAGGWLTIDSRPGGGTIVRADLPLVGP